MTGVRLYFKGVSEIVGTDDLYVLMLTDETEDRQITVVCDRTSAVQLDMRSKQLPVTYFMLPEVLCHIIDTQTDISLHVLISDLQDGQYMAEVRDEDGTMTVPIRISDAVLMCIAGHFPLYIDKGLMQRQSVPYKRNAMGLSLPVNTLSDDMLGKALEKAIQNENYELASRLRDEKKHRGKNRGASPTTNDDTL